MAERSKSVLVGDAPKLAPAKGEEVFKVSGGFGVVGELLGFVVPQPEVSSFMPRSWTNLWVYSFQYWNQSRSVPGLQKNSTSICPNSRVRKVKLPGVISLREALPICATPRGPFAGGALDIGKVDKDAPVRFPYQEDLALGVLGHPLEGFEHQVEFADVGEVGGARSWAFDPSRMKSSICSLVQPSATLPSGVFDQLVSAVAGFAVSFAVHQRVGEAAHMARKPPRFPVHQNERYPAYVVGHSWTNRFHRGFFTLFLNSTPKGHNPRCWPCRRKSSNRRRQSPRFCTGRQFCPWFFAVIHKRSILPRVPFDSFSSGTHAIVLF